MIDLATLAYTFYEWFGFLPPILALFYPDL